MSQADLETRVTACANGCTDGKIMSETATLAGDDPPQDRSDDTAEVAPEYPPESFWLSKDAEFDWFDRNAFYERKDSTKGSSNSANLNPNINPSSNPNSQRSVKSKSKALIIGLPKTQKTTYIDSKRRSCRLANPRLFPNHSISAGKSTVAVAEPSSPKVSCIGRVRSKRSRRRSNSLRKNEAAAAAEKSRTGEATRKKTGFYSKVMSMFRSKKGHKKPARSGSRKAKEEVVVDTQRKSVSIKLRDIPVSVELVAEPPGLGGVKRFSSGRRSCSWTAEDLNAAISESLDLTGKQRL